MQLLKIGGTFENGTVVAIVKAGVTVRMPDGTMTSYDPAAVETIMRQMFPDSSPRRTVAGTCTGRRQQARKTQTSGAA